MKRLYNICSKISAIITGICLIPHIYFCLKFFTGIEKQTLNLWPVITISGTMVLSSLAFFVFNELRDREELKDVLKQFKPPREQFLDFEDF